MLDKLFGSKIRVKILRLFLANPDKKYYIRELTRLLDSQINSIRREVENLSSLGILKDVEGDKTQKKFFKADTGFGLYPELKSLVLKGEMAIKDGVLSDIIKSGNISYLILSGIFVNSNRSPVDIFIVGRVGKKKIERMVKKLEKELDRSVNYTIMSKSEFLYRKQVTDKFLYNILEGNKIVVVDNI